jgi:molybdenum cofactor synthesis domain-containing protein
MPTASVVIIGDEILTGKFQDENGPFFIRRFRTLGVSLVRLVTIRDELDEIAEEVRRCSACSDHVFTTGGVGPTHDDLTFEGIARAFDLPLVEHPDLVALIERFGLPKDAGTMRMAMVPEGTQLMMSEHHGYPVVKVRNVFVLPGVPRLMRQKFETVAPEIAGEAVTCVRVYARDYETHVAVSLGEVADRFSDVAIGSYPRFGEASHKLIVTLESRSIEQLELARDAVVELLDVVKVEGP